MWSVQNAREAFVTISTSQTPQSIKGLQLGTGWGRKKNCEPLVRVAQTLIQRRAGLLQSHHCLSPVKAAERDCSGCCCLLGGATWPLAPTDAVPIQQLNSVVKTKKSSKTVYLVWFCHHHPPRGRVGQGSKGEGLTSYFVSRWRVQKEWKGEIKKDYTGRMRWGSDV